MSIVSSLGSFVRLYRYFEGGKWVQYEAARWPVNNVVIRSNTA